MTDSDQHRTEQQTRDAVNNAMGELREGALGNLPKEVPAEPHAGMIRDDDLRSLLSIMNAATDRPIEQTRLFKDLTRPEATRVATEAIREGNLSQTEYLTGWQNYENDVSGLHTLQRMESWLLDQEAAKVVYLAGHMGSGKTDFAHLCAEVIRFRSRKRDDLREPEMRCNIPSSDLDAITEWPEFREWVESGAVGENRWFFFDEGSQALTGYNADREQVERLMSRLVKLARKFGANLLIIGHTGMDLHADLRRLADYVEKQSKKTARVYATVKRAEGAGHMFDLDRLPPAQDLGFSTADTAPWSWGDALDTDDGLSEQETKRMVARRAAALYRADDVDLSMRKLCDTLSGPDASISTSMLRSALDGEYGEVPVA